MLQRGLLPVKMFVLAWAEEEVWHSAARLYIDEKQRQCKNTLLSYLFLLMRAFVGLPIHPNEPLETILQQSSLRLPQGCVPMPANEWHCTLAGPLTIGQEQLEHIAKVIESSIAKVRFGVRTRANLLHSQWDKNTTALELTPNQELLHLQQRIQEQLLSITPFPHLYTVAAAHQLGTGQHPTPSPVFAASCSMATKRNRSMGMQQQRSRSSRSFTTQHRAAMAAARKERRVGTTKSPAT